jgi:hypothetical protein
MKFEVITPAFAKELLEKNSKNRRVTEGLVDRYARDMTEGRWKANGATIIISENDILLDGQHRLLACVKADLPFSTLIQRGVPDEVRDTIDTGRKRTTGDMLAMAGYSARYANGSAASARTVVNYLRGESLNNAPSTTEVFEFIEEYPDIVDKYALGLPAHKVATGGPLGAVLFLGTRLKGYDKHGVNFVDGITTGIDLRSGDPRLALRNLFLNFRSRVGGSRMPNTIYLFPAITIAWNAFINEESLKLVRPMPTKGGKFRVIDVIGGPAFGSGVAGLDAVRLSKSKVRAIQKQEIESRKKLVSG